ncbi:MAG: hypothetical protein F6K65_30330 [Moorea sp. SIO3C2]|nr:hypothetical protein [Moorena sp. SIO3C2]
MAERPQLPRLCDRILGHFRYMEKQTLGVTSKLQGKRSHSEPLPVREKTEFRSYTEAITFSATSSKGKKTL